MTSLEQNSLAWAQFVVRKLQKFTVRVDYFDILAFQTFIYFLLSVTGGRLGEEKRKKEGKSASSTAKYAILKIDPAIHGAKFSVRE